MKRASLGLPALGLVFLLSGCGSVEFKEFSNADGRFKILFPGTPKEKTQNAGGVTIRMFYVEQRNGGYFVAVNGLPQPVQDRDIKNVLDGARTGALARSGGKLTSESDVTLAGKYPGREINADLTKPAAGKLRTRVYLVGDRMFQVMVMGTGSFVDGADTKKFFDSFQLTGS